MVQIVVGAPGGHGGSWGRVREDEMKHLIKIGWDSVEAHEAFQKTDEFQTKVIGVLSTIMDSIDLVEYWHVPLESP